MASLIKIGRTLKLLSLNLEIGIAPKSIHFLLAVHSSGQDRHVANELSFFVRNENIFVKYEETK